MSFDVPEKDFVFGPKRVERVNCLHDCFGVSGGGVNGLEGGLTI